MNKDRVLTFVGIVSLALIVAISFPLTPTKAETGHEHHGQMGKMDMNLLKREIKYMILFFLIIKCQN